MAGGPPVRGDLLGFWEPDGPVGDDDRRRWEAAARRIAVGLFELAHLPATVDANRLLLAFFCDGDVQLAAAYAQAIGSENVEARVTEVDEAGAVGVALPCRPETTDEEVRHVVLAVVKAAHVGAARSASDRDVLAQLEVVRVVEQGLADAARRLRSLGAGVRHGAARLLRLG